MEQLPNDCVFEIMKHLGPGNIVFMRACKRILALFEKNRAQLERLQIRYKTSQINEKIKYLVELSNTLYPNKKFYIITHWGIQIFKDGKFVENYPFDIWANILPYFYCCNATVKPEHYYLVHKRNNGDGPNWYSFDIRKELSGVNSGYTTFDPRGHSCEKQSEDEIIIKMSYYEIWRFSYEDHARICKHIFKFAEIPGEIVKMYTVFVEDMLKLRVLFFCPFRSPSAAKASELAQQARG